MGCGRATMKSLLICFNVVFCVFSVIIIAGGAFLCYVPSLDTTDSPDTIDTPIPRAGAINVFQIIGIILIVIGSISFFINLLGCCGAAHENKCMLMTFAVLLFFIMVCHVILATLGYVRRDELNNDDTNSDEDSNYGAKIVPIGIAIYCSALFNIMQICFACALAKKTHSLST